MLGHDQMARYIARIVIRKYKKRFGNMYISTVSTDFPKPDFIYVPFDIKNVNEENYPIAFEFKTPYISKHEVMTGIGQAITYNMIFPKSYLIVPEYNIEGFNIASFVYDVVKASDLRIGLIRYDPSNLSDVEIIKESIPMKIDLKEVKETIKNIRRSYAYWRETKPEEVYDALKIARELEYSNKPYTIEVLLRKLWQQVLSNRFRQARRPSSFLLNYKLFLIQTSLIDRNGRLTFIGNHVLHVGERFGKDSQEFRDIITYVLLRFGGHYELLSKIYIEQSKMSQEELSDIKLWLERLAREFKRQNYKFSKEDFNPNRPRLPYAYMKYFSGIINKPVFKPGMGLNINFPKIVEILEKGNKYFASIEQLLE